MLVDFQKEKEFLKRQGYKWIPKSIAKFTALPIADMIIRFNSIANGIANYYSFVDNKRYLRKIIWIVKESLRKTLSRKLNLNKKEFLTRFGKDISYINFLRRNNVEKHIRFVEIDFERRPMLFLGSAEFKDPMTPLYQRVSTINSFNLPCASCGSSKEIEMHHLKHIKTVNANLNEFDKMMARINRKQTPLCRKCHIEVHKGIYQGKSIKNYNKAWVRMN